MKRFHFSFIVVIIIASLSTFHSCRSGNEQPGKKEERKTVSADAIVVIPGLMEDRIFATGTLLASEEVELRSEVSGRVLTINFQEGGLVKKGDLLAKIDDRELQVQLTKLRLEEKLAANDVARKVKLLEINAISQEEYDISLNQLELIQVNMELIRTQISKTEIIAPFSGRIGLRKISAGGYLTPATLIATLHQVDPLKLEFSIPEKYSNKLLVGSSIHFQVEGKTNTFSGKVYAKDPKIEPNTRALILKALCPNPGNSLMPGAFARVDVVLGITKNALSIPSYAIIPVLNGNKVMILEDGKSRSRMVVTGIRTVDQVEVVSGLNPGDTVLVSGLMMLKDSMNVKPIIKMQ